jgi:hypothetical protein
MRVLHKPKKFKVYAIVSSGYSIYSPDWKICFKLSYAYYTKNKKSKTYAIPSCEYFIYALGSNVVFKLS